MACAIEDINNSDRAAFVELLGGIFEHSPWVAEMVHTRRPFNDSDHLHREMVAAMHRAPRGQRMTLLRSHPELAGREADSGSLTDESKREQAGAGLDHCSPRELQKIKTFNQAYRDRFEFPFIIAVTGLNRQQILNAMEQRLENDGDTEFDTALVEVGKIARIRLDTLIDG